MRQPLGNTRLFLMLTIALALTILPMPTILTGFRPQWVLLMVLYIQFFLPHYFRVTWIFLLGLCLDVLLSTAIGEHAFALLLTAWFAAGKTRRFTFFSTLQQMILIVVFCLLYQSVIYLIEASQGYSNGIFFVAETAFISMLFWPWVKWLADNSLRGCMLR